VRGRLSDLERPITLIRTDATTSAAGLRRALEIAPGDQPELALTFSTIHRATGAEADVVVLLNMKGWTRGCPSGVQDDPLMWLILGENDA
jgi:superfamily I DNA/RNA helicase